tara:strand:- start:27 stop:479 length:453 start_codon:yes stop_codon:yes gene_type:complete
MKKIIYFFLFLFTLNCSINKVSNIHGFRSIDAKYEKIIINSTNKNDIRKIIGPPSSISKFDDIWYYIERKKTNQSIARLGKKKLSKNNILMVQFNNMGIVSKKELFNVNDMNSVKIFNMKSRKKYEQDNLAYDILSTLREKINAPTRRKK